MTQDFEKSYEELNSFLLKSVDPEDSTVLDYILAAQLTLQVEQLIANCQLEDPETGKIFFQKEENQELFQDLTNTYGSDANFISWREKLSE